MINFKFKINMNISLLLISLQQFMIQANFSLGDFTIFKFLISIIKIYIIIKFSYKFYTLLSFFKIFVFEELGI